MNTIVSAFHLKVPKIIFGLNTIERIEEEINRYDGRRILFVTDEILEKIGLVNMVLRYLDRKSLSISFFKVSPEPTVEIANEVASVARRNIFDLVIGLGGGSCLDMAKVASIAPTNPGDIRQYIGVNKVKKAGLPKILVPTTAGTGSEVTPNAIVVTSDDLMKSGIISEYNVADVAIVDPQLTISMPPRLTAITGLDALSHAIESYMSTKSNIVTDALNPESIKLILTSLYQAFLNGKDITARTNMSMAALLAGITLSISGTCAGHAAAYAFAAKYNVPHGLSCAISLPYMIEYNADSCPSKIIEIARIIGKDVSKLSLEEATKSIVREITTLMERLSIPCKLKDIGIPHDDIPLLAKNMVKNIRLLENNPKQVSEEDAVKIFQNMWSGKFSQ